MYYWLNSCIHLREKFTNAKNQHFYDQVMLTSTKLFLLYCAFLIKINSVHVLLLISQVKIIFDILKGTCFYFFSF